jgi:hypothetical protein
MLQCKSEKQLSIFDFHANFESKLNPDNLWVKMMANLRIPLKFSEKKKKMQYFLGLEHINDGMV